MQEEIEHKTVNLAISTTKLSARTLLAPPSRTERLPCVGTHFDIVTQRRFLGHPTPGGSFNK